MAAILASLHMQRADDLFGGPQGSPRTDRLIEASIQWAERIMRGKLITCFQMPIDDKPEMDTARSIAKEAQKSVQEMITSSQFAGLASLLLPLCLAQHASTDLQGCLFMDRQFKKAIQEGAIAV